MLGGEDISRFAGVVASWGTTRPNATTMGVSVTPSTGAYGSYVALLSALAQDCYGLLICIHSNYTAAASRNSIITIGIDEAGGTSYADTILHLLCGSASDYNIGSGGIWYYFPIYIKAGATVGVKARSSVTTAFRVAAKYYNRPSHPHSIRVGSYVDCIGTTTEVGTAITPGTTSEGSWTTIGTTSRDAWWLQLGLQVGTADTSWNANAIHVDVAYGDATNKEIIASDRLWTSSTNEYWFQAPEFFLGCVGHIPSGTTIYMRAQASGTLDTGMNTAVYLLGG